MKLRDKIAVITGAGSGIGRATAHAFVAAGARVAVCDVDRTRVDALALELGDRAIVARAIDVSDRKAMSIFAAEIHDLTPAVDVVVNNAGVALGGTFLESTLDDWDWLLGVNLHGVVYGCHYFLPKMVERGTGGHIINISSIFGIYPAPQVAAYVASKFAVLGFSQSLRAEMAPHRIGVTAICPGMINTGIIQGGRMTGGVSDRRDKLARVFTRGAPPSLVADAILDAVQTNPAVRTVGKDAWAVHQLTRLAPTLSYKLGTRVSKMFGRSA